MDQAVYVGPLKELEGMTALVRPDDTYDNPDIEQRTLEAQFHRFNAEHPETGADLAFGWHTFPVKHFKILGM